MVLRCGSWKCAEPIHMRFSSLEIRKLLPEQVELISGPGCPVCVTQVGFIDEAIYLALERQVTICTFGDLVRVPGTNMSLAGQEKGYENPYCLFSSRCEGVCQRTSKGQVTFLSVGLRPPLRLLVFL